MQKISDFYSKFVSATDTEEKAAKPLTCGAVALFEAVLVRNRFSNAFSGFNRSWFEINGSFRSRFRSSINWV
jgi:hypothetical protein